MNTSVETNSMNIAERPAPVRAAPHATHKFKLLLKREFWEHKGGFFWAPIWAGGISLVLTLMALIFAEVAARRAVEVGKMHIGRQRQYQRAGFEFPDGSNGPQGREASGQRHRLQHAERFDVAHVRAWLRGVLLLPWHAVRRTQGPQRAVLEIAASVRPRHRAVQAGKCTAGRSNPGRWRCHRHHVRLPDHDQRVCIAA